LASTGIVAADGVRLSRRVMPMESTGIVAADGVQLSRQVMPAVESTGIITADGIRLSRQVMSVVESKADRSIIRLYQYQTCPYCCKVRAALDYYGYGYEVVEVNPVTRRQIKFSTTYKKVPIVVFQEDNQQVNDSSVIVSLLASLRQGRCKSVSHLLDNYPSHESVDPKTNKTVIEYPNKYVVMTGDRLSKDQLVNAREEREWRSWVDDKFIHLISPNVYRTWQEAIDTFHWFSEAGDWKSNFSTWERLSAIYIGAVAMFFIAKRLKKRHKIDDERKAIIEACNEWLAAIGPSRPFLGGKQPNLADLALYGAMCSFEGCVAFSDISRETKIVDWFNRTREAVKNKRGALE